MRTHRNDRGQVVAPRYEELVLDELELFFGGLFLGLMLELVRVFPQGIPQDMDRAEMLRLVMKRWGSV